MRKQRIKEFLWLSYFGILLVNAVLSVLGLSLLTLIQKIDFATLRSCIEALVVLVVLYEFVFQHYLVSKKVNRFFFGYFAVVFPVEMVAGAAKIDLGMLNSFFKTTLVPITPVHAVFSTLFILPAFYALYRLAYSLSPFLYRVPREVNPNPYSQMAITSAVAGLLGIIFGPFTTIPALITGIIALVKIKKNHYKGKWLAIFGIVSFVVNTIFLILIITFFMRIIHSDQFKKLAASVSGGGNDEAVQKMTATEKAFLQNKLLKITNTMGQDEVIALLGEPRGTKEILYSGRFYYDCPEKKDSCTLGVNFLNDKVDRILWIDTGRFMYVYKPQEKPQGLPGVEQAAVRDTRVVLNEAMKKEIETKGVQYALYSHLLDSDYSYSQLTEGQKVLYTAWDVEGEVGNGGFDQYLYNTEGLYLDDAIAHYKVIGDERNYAVMKEIKSIFEKNKEYYLATADVTISPQTSAQITKLDQAISKNSEASSTLLDEYIHAHFDEFFIEETTI